MRQISRPAHARRLAPLHALISRTVLFIALPLLALPPVLMLHPGPVSAQDLIALKLAPAPSVPPPVGRALPARVTVELEAKEFRAPLAEGTDYEFWSFNGTVPGPFIRVREGDTIELTLNNDVNSKFSHSIDLHAVNGPGGGSSVTQTQPGDHSSFVWKALHPGLYIYHCATPPVPVHVANGMYGLIFVEPYGGLPKVDREYYVMQSEFYTQGRPGAHGLQAYSLDKADREEPDYVVFNGRVGSLTGEGALTAKVGEKVRLFVGNIGPNLISSFHVIGEVFDEVYPGGAVSGPTLRNLQTVLIPAGGAAIVDFTPLVPGTYIMIDHSLNRAFDKGALGQLDVTGPEQPGVFSPMGGAR